jgi:hypothetical protein
MFNDSVDIPIEADIPVDAIITPKPVRRLRVPGAIDPLRSLTVTQPVSQPVTAIATTPLAATTDQTNWLKWAAIAAIIYFVTKK